MVIRICAAPGARWLVNAVTIESIRTAVGNNAGWLFGQKFRRKYNQGFQRDLVTYMLTIPDLAYVPLFLRHTAPPDYVVILY
jgi:hypothetical protein